MVSGSEMKFHVQCGSRPEEVGYEFHAVIGSDMAWNAMLGENVENE